jgi:HSP20 family protein
MYRRYRRDLWPFDEFERLRSEINQLFEDDATSGTTGLFDRSTSPRLDVVETDDALMVACDLPGVEAKDIELDVVNNVLTLRGEKHPSAGVSGKGEVKNYRRETWHGSFQRTLALPDSVDPDKVSAELRNGVLSIHLAKREERKPKRIGIKVK